MRLQLGSGEHPCAGWVNVDVRSGFRPDIVADGCRLPFPPATFERVYLGHVLEHLRWEDQLPAVLAEVRRVCTADALVGVVGPDIGRAIATGQPAWLLEQVVGDGDPADPGTHQWVATERLTARALTLAGFRDVTPTSPAQLRRPDWPNTVADPWQCALTARP